MSLTLGGVEGLEEVATGKNVSTKRSSGASQISAATAAARTDAAKDVGSPEPRRCTRPLPAMPGVFTATLKVMIDIDAQPALESVSLDQVVVSLLSCFAKCYGKGDAQNRRGIIQFAAAKVTEFRTFVTLRFSVATRMLSRISKPLSLCNDPNFWYACLSPESAPK